MMDSHPGCGNLSIQQRSGDTTSRAADVVYRGQNRERTMPKFRSVLLAAAGLLMALTTVAAAQAGLSPTARCG